MPKREAAEVVIFDLKDASDEQRAALAALAIETYRGELCRFCKEPVASDEDLRDSVFAGYHDGGRSAHGRCWRALPEDEKAALREEAIK